MSLFSGKVTFLFTDIEGRTKLAQQDSDAMPVMLARHQEILHLSIQTHDGHVFQVVDDLFMSAFESAFVEGQKISPDQALDLAT